MGCNSCSRNPCACDVIPLPYYEDPCFQESQSQGCQIYNQYSPVLRIATAWAVPEAGNIITLKVVALADMLIGAYIYNPTYGKYEVVSYDPDGQQIKVVKLLTNNREVGLPIPACTKFIVTAPTEIEAEVQELIERALQELFVFTPFTPAPAAVGAGSLSNVDISLAQYSSYGDAVFISIIVTAELITGTANYIEFTLPFDAATTSLGSQDVTGSFNNNGTAGVASFRVQEGTNKCRVYKSDLTTFGVSGDMDFAANFFYKR